MCISYDPVVPTKYIQQKNKQTIKGHAPEWLQQHYKAVKPNRYTYNIPTAEDTFFSSTHRTFSMIDYVLRHKTSLIKIDSKKAKQYIYSDHSGMTLPKIMEGKLENLLI